MISSFQKGRERRVAEKRVERGRRCGASMSRKFRKGKGYTLVLTHPAGDGKGDVERVYARDSEKGRVD